MPREVDDEPFYELLDWLPNPKVPKHLVDSFKKSGVVSFLCLLSFFSPRKMRSTVEHIPTLFYPTISDSIAASIAIMLISLVEKLTENGIAPKGSRHS